MKTIARRRRRQSSKHHRASEFDLRAFGALIARKRMQKGISSESMSKMIGVSKSSLSRIENGSREPRFEIVRRLHQILNITDDVVRYLEGGNFNDLSRG